MSDERDDQLMSVRGLDLPRVFQEPPEGFTDAEATSAWATLDLLEKAVKERKETLRLSLLQRAQEHGTKGESGSFTGKLGTGDYGKIPKDALAAIAQISRATNKAVGKKKWPVPVKSGQPGYEQWVKHAVDMYNRGLRPKAGK